MMLKILVTCAGLLVSSMSLAGRLAYVDWSRSAEEGKKTWGYKAFDGNPGSAWCSGADGIGDTLTLGFIGATPIDEIGVIVGVVRKGKLDKSQARVRELTVSDERTRQVLSFRDKVELQSIKFEPALNSQKITFTIERAFLGAQRSSPVCISEIVLRHKGRLVGGDSSQQAVRELRPSQQKLLHLWIDAPGAPERYLTFGIDGRFQWVYEPILEGKPARLKGTWSRVGSHLLLKPSRGKPVKLTFRMARVADGDQVMNQLQIEGDGPHKALSHTYQTAAAR